MEENTELNNRVKEYEKSSKARLEIERLLAEVTKDQRMMVSYELGKFENKIKVDTLKDSKPVECDLSSVINIIHQAQEMYEDIIKG